MTKYTNEVRSIFKSLKAPYRGMVVDLIEYPGHMALRVYDDNLAGFSDPQLIALAEYLYRLRDTMRSVDAPVEIERVPGAPGNSLSAR